MTHRYNRSASLAITAFGSATNFALCIQVLAAWRSLKLEPESEWEGSNDNWRLDGVKIFWALLSAYFASATAVCVVGFAGIVKSKPSLVRFYRDYSIADFSFCAFSTLLATYGAFRTSARAGVCEEFSHHPELMRDMQEMGLNLENCERWLERAAFAVLSVMFIIILVRIHFLLAVSNYYTYLTRHQRLPLPTHHRDHTHSSSPSSSAAAASSSTSNAMQRIFLLPRSSPSSIDDVEMVYAPVPLNSLPKELQASARAAWVSQPSTWVVPSEEESEMSSASSSSASSSASSAPGSPMRHHHRHHHHHHYRRSSRSSSTDNQTGRIRLPIGPNEGLLPPVYTKNISESKA